MLECNLLFEFVQFDRYAFLASGMRYMVSFVSESNDIPDLVGVRDAAAVLRVSEQAIRGMISRGDLAGRRVGRAWVLEHADVQAFARERGIADAQPKNKFKLRASRRRMSVLSFFSGAMGLDLGLESAGLRTIMACELDKWSRRTIETNRPKMPLLGDVWQYDASSLREALGLTAADEIDVVAGGPPCQAFSTAGARKGFDDDRGNVFLHFVRLALDLRPRYLVIENVRGLLSAPMAHRPHAFRGGDFPDLELDEMPGGALRFVVALIRSEGYEISFDLYNAANFGSPQTRERVIIICSRDGSRVQRLSPTHSQNGEWGLEPWVTFREAAGDFREVDMEAVAFPESRLKYYRMLGPGEHWRNLPNHLQQEALGKSYFSGGGKTGFLRRLSWDKPSPTLVTHPAMPATDLGHPQADRPLSIQEYLRIQEFPDNWEIQGPLIQRYKQVGNAVPVGLGRAVGRVLRAHAKGQTLPIPEGFRYSRYRDTDLDSWEASGVPVSRAKSRLRGEATLF